MINKKNLLVVVVLVIVNVVAFLWGKYQTLMPFFYIAGFVGISIISFWFGNRVKTKDLIVLAVSATLLSLFDEYAHTSAGTLSYFDQAVPSPLTVFGWSIFMISVVAITKLLVDVQFLQIRDNEKLRTSPVIVSLILIVTVAVLQDYLVVFNWVLVLVYLFLFAASFYYAHVHPLKWNILLMLISLVLGLGMEYAGGLEGLWTFRFNDPISLLILFSWPLRIWAVNAICFAFEVDFSKNYEKRKIDSAPELDAKKSIIVVADTHLGLRKEKENCDPKAFSDFLDWIASLEQNDPYELNVGDWGVKDARMTITPPEKMVFLGDILELWDTTRESVDVCSRSIIQTLSKLKCQKIYVLGNHDHELSDVSGKYPLGQAVVNILKGEYATNKGSKKLIFLHGHQFDRLFALPSWRIMPLFNKVAAVFGKFTLFFVALFGIDIAMYFAVGFGAVADWVALLSLGAVSIPFLIVGLGRSVWNNYKTTKYEPEQAEKGVEKWWNAISRMENAGETNVVYGHTHSMGFWSEKIGEDWLTLYNLPSWVRNKSTRAEIPLENVFRHGFLYIDEEATEFIGWDTRKKRPFFIPRSLVQNRQQADLPVFETAQIRDRLLRINWPVELIKKWSAINLPERGLT